MTGLVVEPPLNVRNAEVQVGDLAERKLADVDLVARAGGTLVHDDTLDRPVSVLDGDGLAAQGVLVGVDRVGEPLERDGDDGLGLGRDELSAGAGSLVVVE